MLDGDGLRLVSYRFFHGYDVHTDACASGRHHGSHAFKRQSCHLVEEVGDFGMLLDKGPSHVEEFRSAGNEKRKHPLLMVILVLPVVFEDADAAHLKERVGKLLLIGPAGESLDLFEGCGLAMGGHCERNVDHIVVQYVDKTPEFGIFLGELDKTELLRDPVGHLSAENKKLFFVCDHM